MTSALQTRLGALCGVLFSVVLFVASGSGSGPFNATRAVAGLAALALFTPFLAYLVGVLRAAEGERGWLASTVLVAGTVGITIKVVSVMPALALHRANVADGTRLHKLFDAFDNGATVIALYPLAVACAAIAILALRAAALPRWLGIGAALTAVALAVNGAFLGADFVPALLLFVLWVFLASVHLLRISWRPHARVQTAAGR